MGTSSRHQGDAPEWADANCRAVLAGHEFRPRSKHGSDQAGYDIEAGVFKRESFSVAFHETSVQAFSLGTRLRALYQVRRDVHAGSIHSIPCRP